MVPARQRETEHSAVTRRTLLRMGAMAGAGLAVSTPGSAQAAEVRIAVASGFAPAAQDIARRFSARTGHVVTLEFGASGRLYARIFGGSGVHAFLSADEDRPARAEAAGLVVPGSRFTYAIGRLVLWSTNPDLVDANGRVLKNKGALPSLALANPVISRHGAAAAEVLRSLEVYDRLRPVLVTAADSLAVRDMVADGDAAAGFVPPSVVTHETGGSRWLVPSDLHEPIRLQAVLLVAGMRNAAARAFLSFLREQPARDIMASYGYESPITATR